MASLRKPIPFERLSPGCGGDSHPRKPAPEAGRSGLAEGFQAGLAERFQMAVWLLEQQVHLSARRVQGAMLLVLGNVMLITLVVLLSFLVLGGNPNWWPLLVAAILILTCLVVSTLCALLAGAAWPAGGGSSALGAGIFCQGGPTPGLSAAQFSQRFQQATRQQMLDGALGELYAQRRRRARQGRWFRWALAAFGLAIVLFTLTVVAVLVALVL